MQLTPSARTMKPVPSAGNRVTRARAKRGKTSNQCRLPSVDETHKSRVMIGFSFAVNLREFAVGDFQSNVSNYS